jgi:hypothetical protein
MQQSTNKIAKTSFYLVRLRFSRRWIYGSRKNGKVKLTVELEVNQPLMELIKQNVEMMSEAAAQGMTSWREKMGSGKQGHGMGMMMHHGQE